MTPTAITATVLGAVALLAIHHALAHRRDRWVEATATARLEADNARLRRHIELITARSDGRRAGDTNEIRGLREAVADLEAQLAAARATGRHLAAITNTAADRTVRLPAVRPRRRA